MSRDGVVVIPLEFEATRFFTEELAAAKKWRRWGYLDRDGRWVLEPRFTFTTGFADGLAVIQLEENGPYGFIDRAGTAPFNGWFEEAGPFAEGRARIGHDGLQGFIDRDGTLRVEPQFDDAWAFSEGLAAVSTNGAWGFIDHHGVMRIPPTFSEAYPFKSGMAPVAVDGVWGFIHPDGSWAIRPRFSAALSFSEELAAVADESGTWGYVRRDGDWAFPSRWQRADVFNEQRAPVFTNGLWSYIDTTGASIQPRAALGAAQPFGGGLSRVAIARPIAPGSEVQEFVDGYVDRDGNVIWPPNDSGQ
jgi:hypothetical protein